MFKGNWERTRLTVFSTIGPGRFRTIGSLEVRIRLETNITKASMLGIANLLVTLCKRISGTL